MNTAPTKNDRPHPPRLTGSLLVVDDNEMKRYAVSRTLRAAGHRVVEAVDGQEALRAAFEVPPDVVVLDVKLPDIMGFEVTRRLKSDPRTTAVMILHLSASYTTPQAQALGLDLGADGYLVQPVEPEVLLATVQSLLRLRQVERDVKVMLTKEQGRLQRAQSLAKISELLHRNMAGDVLSNVARLIGTQLEGGCAIRLVDDESQTLGLAAVYEPNPGAGELLWELDIRYPQHLEDAATMIDTLAEGVPRILSHFDTESFEARINSNYGIYFDRYPIKSLVLVPLQRRGRAIGLLAVTRYTEGNPFLESDFEFFADLGRRLSLAIENSRLYRQVVHTARIREELMATVFHDLRNPITALNLKAESLKHALGQGRYDTALERADDLLAVSARLDALLHELRDASANRETGSKGQTVGSLLQDVRVLFEPLAEAQGVKLSLQDTGSVDTALDVNRNRAGQIFSNLIGNALKFSLRGGEIEVNWSKSNEHEVCFTVSDQGPGIAFDDQSKIFEKGFRGETDSEGSGLGLYITRTLVEAHGGRIWLESNPDAGGSRFHFTLPVAGRAEEDQAHEKAQATALGRLAKGAHLGGATPPSRESLHERE